jgi:hypothetical protein
MTGQRGRLEKLMPDKTGLSDVSMSSAPAHVAGKRPQCQPAALPNGGAPRI